MATNVALRPPWMLGWPNPVSLTLCMSKQALLVRLYIEIVHDAVFLIDMLSGMQYDKTATDLRPLYSQLIDQYQMLIYSGDTDGAVPTYGTKQWIKELGWDVVEPWRQWLTNGTPSGYVEKYDGLDFVTVKGVGHMAPQWARQAVTEMMSAYIHDEDF